eukprot:TRINITY_DN10735_c0_g1_i2.p1 TRINITY_DN10735_c0_g1~~TRINITY_DN10735_c0_g1_i2.p1  ORF type:complete len:292 (+),score=86.51 TRINITY_DN10735_c0_g1_i2:59-934(+)
MLLRRLFVATRRSSGEEALLSAINGAAPAMSSSSLFHPTMRPASMLPNQRSAFFSSFANSNIKKASLVPSVLAYQVSLTQQQQIREFTTKGPRRQNKLKANESEARKQPRRVKAFCTADEYDFDELTKYLSKHHVTTFLSDTTLHIRKIVKHGVEEATTADEITSDIFYFKNGCIVAWGSTPEEEKQLLAEVRQFEKKPSDLPESEEMEWLLGAQSGLKHGSVLVINADAEERDKMHDQLAFSWGLVHSVKISALEEYAAMTLDKMRDIPQILSKTGKLDMTSHEVLQDVW